MATAKWRKFQIGASKSRASYAGSIFLTPGPIGSLAAGAKTVTDYLLGAKALNTDGEIIRVRVFGFTAANGNNKQIQILWGGTTFFDSTALALNDLKFMVELRIARQSHKLQVGYGNIVYTAAPTTPVRVAGAVDETADQHLIIRLVQATADNDMVVDFADGEMLTK